MTIIDGISHGVPHIGNPLPLVDQPWGGSLEEDGGLSESGASHRDVSVEAHLAGSNLARGGSLAAGFRTFDEDRSVGAQALTQHVVHDSGEILLLTRCGCHEMTFAVFKQTIEVLYFR